MKVNAEGFKGFVGAFVGDLERVSEVSREQNNQVFDLSQRIAALQDQQTNEEMVVMTNAEQMKLAKKEEMKKVVIDTLKFLGTSHEEAVRITNQLHGFDPKTGLIVD